MSAVLRALPGALYSRFNVLAQRVLGLAAAIVACIGFLWNETTARRRAIILSVLGLAVQQVAICLVTYFSTPAVLVIVAQILLVTGLLVLATHTVPSRPRNRPALRTASA